MNRWIRFKNGQYPRKGEIIMVKGNGHMHPHALIAEDSLDWYEIEWDAKLEKMVKGSVKLMSSGLTHWTLLESPY